MDDRAFGPIIFLARPGSPGKHADGQGLWLMKRTQRTGKWFYASPYTAVAVRWASGDGRMYPFLILTVARTTEVRLAASPEFEGIIGRSRLSARKQEWAAGSRS